MIKEIRYNGHTAAPSDYDCPDVTLAASLDLIAEDGALRPIFPPTTILDCAEGFTVRAVHHTSDNCDNYLLTSVDQTTRKVWLSWMPRPADNDCDTPSAAPINMFDQVKDIAIFNNTLAVNTGTSVYYLLWRDGDYIRLGRRPPQLALSFGLTRKNMVGSDTLTVPGQYISESSGSTMHPLTTREGDTEDDIKCSNAVWGYLFKNVNSQVTEQGYFWQPFFVRYAYRLYDGTHAWHSAPVLMLPTTLVPIMKATVIEQSTNSKIKTDLSDIGICSLVYKLLTSTSISSLSYWQDIITGIDIAITAPIYTYDSTKNITNLTTTYSLIQSGSSLRGRQSGSGTSAVFAGHYNTTLTDDGYVDHTATGDTSTLCWQIPRNADFDDEIKRACVFYNVAFLDFAKLKDIISQSTQSFAPVPIDSAGFKNLTTLSTLEDDYISNHTLAPTCITVYNNRMHYAGVDIYPPEPQPVNICLPYQSTVGAAENIKCKVFSRINGINCATNITDSFEATYRDMANGFPRFIYYPDASAYRMEISFNSKTYVLPLTPHDFLNGAYYYGDMLSPSALPTSADAASADAASAFASVRNKVYVSDPGNPFVYRPEAIVTVGTGDIIGLSSAAKAMSQGQFGQYPLYAFSSDGVWALAVNSSGTYSSCQPVSRDVCINADSITQLDSSVAFVTARGIMMLSGNSAACFSDAITADSCFDVMTLPRLSQCLASLTCPAPLHIPTEHPLTYLQGCRMLYAYTHQRIIAFNTAYDYAYVFSLKSKQWGMTSCQITAPVNAYPEPLAMSGGKLVSFDTPDTQEQQKTLAVTRPLKLDAPDVLKRVDTVIQRGHFAKTHVKSILYGSRDLINWHLIWTSQDHYLRGYRGTPYKYYRIALVSALTPADSIVGATLQFTPVLNNQPR